MRLGAGPRGFAMMLTLLMLLGGGVLVAQRERDRHRSMERDLHSRQLEVEMQQKRNMEIVLELQEQQHLLEEQRRSLDAMSQALAKRDSQKAPAVPCVQPDAKQLPESAATLFIITPTYGRLAQKADLTRMIHTLLHVPKMHWILIEDSEATTPMVVKLLAASKLQHVTHLAVRTPKEMQRNICTKVDRRQGCPKHLLGKEEALWKKPRGVAQRNAGIALVRGMNPDNGVVYFADDDNTYSLELFERIRGTKYASVFTVGLTGGLLHEGPVIQNGVVSGWHTGWRPQRPFPVDMAGFAINARAFVEHPRASFSPSVPRGYLESSLLAQLVRNRSELEPVGADLDHVMVWHTRTENPSLSAEKHAPSDESLEV